MYTKEMMLNKPDRISENVLKTLSPTALSFIGDSVYELQIRLRTLEKGNRRAAKLNSEKVSKVNAKAQAEIMEKISVLLTEEEKSVYRRGKNAKQRSTAKNQSIADYHKASGFEALMGYLYLKGEDDRIALLIDTGLSDKESDENE